MRILVVDDKQANRKLLAQTLRRSRHEVVEASSGREAVELAAAEPIDMVLMDIMMPDMNGYEATAKIKAQFTDVYIPVIFVTALKAEDALARSVEAGGDDFISKPINFEILESKIHAHTRIKELTEELLEKNKKLEEFNMALQREQALIEHFFDNAAKRCELDPGLIKQHMQPASVFSGDVFLACRKPNGDLNAILGDFTGHGLAAAIGILPVSQIFFDFTARGCGIEEIAQEIHKQLRELLPTGMFFAATLVELSASDETLKLWVGGMPSAYMVDAERNKVTEIPSDNLALGIAAAGERTFESMVMPCNRASRLYLYTDGVIETSNDAGEMLGEERVRDILARGDDSVFDSVLDAIAQFRGEVKHDDDISFVEITCAAIHSSDNAQEV